MDPELPWLAPRLASVAESDASLLHSHQKHRGTGNATEESDDSSSKVRKEAEGNDDSSSKVRKAAERNDDVAVSEIHTQ